MENLIHRVQIMPRIPSPFTMRNWKEVARGYDALVFNSELQGKYLPLISWERKQPNFLISTFRLPSYVGQAAKVRRSIS